MASPHLVLQLSHYSGLSGLMDEAQHAHHISDRFARCAESLRTVNMQVGRVHCVHEKSLSERVAVVAFRKMFR